MDVKEIEIAISQLPPTAVAKLAKWFEEFHARVWDTRIEEDSKRGRLDSLVSEAAQEFESDRCEPL